MYYNKTIYFNLVTQPGARIRGLLEGVIVEVQNVIKQSSIAIYFQNMINLQNSSRNQCSDHGKWLRRVQDFKIFWGENPQTPIKHDYLLVSIPTTDPDHDKRAQL